MKLDGQCKILRIFIGEGDRHKGRPLYQAITELAREKGLAGATVLRGVLGYGANSRLHTDRILRLSEDLPMVVEIVDVEEKITEFLPLLDDLITEGLVTVENVRVIAYRSNAEKYGQRRSK